MLEYAQTDSNKKVSWNYQIVKDWVKEVVFVSQIQKPGNNDWSNMVAQHVDYLINPSIKYKNRVVATFFVEHFLA